MFGDLDDTEVPSVADLTEPPRKQAPIADTARPERVVPVASPPASRAVSEPGFIDEDPVWADADLVSDPGARPIPWNEAETLSQPAAEPEPVAVALPALLELSAPPNPSAEHAIEAQKAAWAPPVFADGASPWSEIVETQGAHRGARGSFPGYEESLPGLVPEGILPSSAVVVPVPPTPVAVPPPAPAITRVPDPVLPLPQPPTVGAVARAPRAPKVVVAAMVVGLIVLGGVAAVMRAMPSGVAPSLSNPQPGCKTPLWPSATTAASVWLQ